MKGDATCPAVLACSLYDTKKVHIISNMDENFKWTPIKHKVYSKTEKNTVHIKFHCLNVIHMYNLWMGSVDVTDQLHMQYRPYRWMRNRKWWWYIFILGLGGAVTNAYLIYRETICQDKRNKMCRVPNEMSHLQVLKSLSTHLMTFKKSKLQQLINTSVVAATSGKKISNDMTLTSFDSRMSRQIRAEVLDVRATPVSKNTLATKFPPRLDG